MHDHNDAHWKMHILTDADNIQYHPAPSVEPCLLAVREHSLLFVEKHFGI